MTDSTQCEYRTLEHPAVRHLPRRRLDPLALEALVRRLAVDPAVWRPHVRHDPDERWHFRLHWTPWVEVYLLGWTDDQDTRLHDHGGSVGAFSVTEGVLFEEYGRVRASRLHRRWHAAGRSASFDADYLHNLGHRQHGTATSVHAYSPPLRVMRFYEPDARGTLVPAYQLPVAGPEPDDEAIPMLLDRPGEVIACA